MLGKQWPLTVVRRWALVIPSQRLEATRRRRPSLAMVLTCLLCRWTVHNWFRVMDVRSRPDDLGRTPPAHLIPLGIVPDVGLAVRYPSTASRHPDDVIFQLVVVDTDRVSLLFTSFIVQNV
jgi:hypothetical protein